MCIRDSGSTLVGVADGDQVHVAADEEAFVFVFIFVDADGKDGEIGLIAVEFEERGQFQDARFALTPPEVEQDNPAAVAGQMDGGCAVGDGEIGGCLAGLGGMRAAVATGDEGHRQKQGE